MLRAAVYLRISSDPSGLRAGVDRQRQDCEQLAAGRSWQVVEVYEDNDTSADNGKPRPQYRRLLEDLDGGRLDAVVTWSLDRLHRRPVELEEFIALADARQVALATVAGDVDLGTPEGRLHARIMGAVAKHENDAKSRRLRRKSRELAEQGRPGGGGHRPFGYQADRVTVDQREAELIREAAGRVLSGHSLRSICGDWTRRGITTSAGSAWRTGVLRSILLSARVVGMREYQGRVVGRAVWPPILDTDTHQAVRAVLQDPARAFMGGPARSYLLTGFAVCGVCGRRLVARPVRAGVRSYACPSGTGFGGCGKIRRLAEPVEAEVTRRLLKILNSEEFTAALREAGGDHERQRELLDQLRLDDATLDQLADWLTDGTLDRPRYLREKARVTGRMEAANRELSRLASRNALAGLPSGRAALEQAWEGAGLEWRRVILAAVVQRVELLPARRGDNRFDPSKVRVVWRV